MYEQHQGNAPQPPGQSGGCVQVQVCGFGTGEEEDLGGLLVGELRGRDHGGVAVDFRLAVEKHKCYWKIVKTTKWEVLRSPQWFYTVVLLTTSGASMSCRKEWRLRTDRGFLMRVKGQRSEVIGVMKPLWTLQWRNHTWDEWDDSFTLREGETKSMKTFCVTHVKCLGEKKSKGKRHVP